MVNLNFVVSKDGTIIPYFVMRQLAMMVTDRGMIATTSMMNAEV